MVRYAVQASSLKKYKIANFATGIKVKFWNQNDQQAVDDGTDSQYANFKFREHYGLIQDLLMKYPPHVAREKYEDFKKHSKYIRDDVKAFWKVNLSHLYYEKYKDENKIRKVKEHQRNWIDKHFPAAKRYHVDRKWFSEYTKKIWTDLLTSMIPRKRVYRVLKSLNQR